MVEINWGHGEAEKEIKDILAEAGGLTQMMFLLGMARRLGLSPADIMDASAEVEKNAEFLKQMHDRMLVLAEKLKGQSGKDLTEV